MYNIENLKIYTDMNLDEFKTIGCIIKALRDEINVCKSIIDSFFTSECCGNVIKNKILPFITDDNKLSVSSIVLTVDLTTVNTTYNEYYGGMIQFINEIKQHSDADDNDSNYNDLLEKAGEKDNGFIDSLFTAIEHMGINKAFNNIVILTDFYNIISTYVRQISISVEGVETIDSRDELLFKSVEMVYSSLTNYINSFIKSAFGTYDSIVKAIDENGKNKESNPSYTLL